MINILIVDDQKHIRDGLQAMLHQFPLELNNIYCAASGVEALCLLRQYCIHIVITDIMMPDMDGLALMAQTKEEYMDVEYLIISGYRDFTYAQKAIGLGAKGYLLKPLKREDLQNSLEHVWQEIQTRQALTHNMQRVSRLAQETDRKELRMFMQGALSDDAWILQIEEQNDALWRNYRLALLREEVCMNQPGASSAHSMEAIAYRVFGKQGCICLQHRPYLILAVDASIDPSVLPAALKEGKIDAITAMTNPIQG
ncbi:response regulator [Paenibacillus sp. OVF10]|nr:response regulator [Paenibacillus sp. OVF10]